MVCSVQGCSSHQHGAETANGRGTWDVLWFAGRTRLPLRGMASSRKLERGPSRCRRQAHSRSDSGGADGRCQPLRWTGRMPRLYSRAGHRRRLRAAVVTEVVVVAVDSVVVPRKKVQVRGYFWRVDLRVVWSCGGRGSEAEECGYGRGRWSRAELSRHVCWEGRETLEGWWRRRWSSVAVVEERDATSPVRG